MIELIESGSALKPHEVLAGGMPFFEVNNILPYEFAEASEFTSRTDIKTLACGDFVTGRVGSIGNFAIYRGAEAAGFSDNVLRFRLSPEQAIRSEFVLHFLNSTLAAGQIAKFRKGSLQGVIKQTTLKTVVVPVLGDAKEKEIVAAMDAARAERRAKLAEADALLAGLDDFLLATLGLTPPPRPRDRFAIRAYDLAGVLNPDRYRGMQLERHLPFTSTVAATGSLLEERCAPEKEDPEALWDWIRIDDLPNQPWQVETMRTELGKNISGTFFEVRENDILIARLGPTIQNAKFVLCPRLQRRTVASSEFLVLRCNSRHKPEAVLWLLRTALYREIMYLRSRGATPSRFRLDGGDLLTIPFPQMHSDVQETIAAEARRRREEARRLRAEAEAGWQAAKRWFEEQLLGPAQP